MKLNKNQYFKRKHLSGLVVLALMTGTAQAGKITSMPSASGADGFGGWNEDNVEIIVNDGSYNPSDGSYVLGADSDGSYVGMVNDGAGTPTGVALGKDWPVGEPPGIKVVNDDANVKAPKPPNCIMTTSYLDAGYLDTDNPVQNTCSGPFQSHKRYKIGMLPSSIDGVGADAIDLVFNVEAEAGQRSYQIYQKINNWTGSRLEGFQVQIGTGVGANFQTASEAGINLADLNISIPEAIWPVATSDVAVFSIGLFGPPDDKHPTTGYFDPDQRAGFEIAEHGDPTLTDTLNSVGTLGSDYVPGLPDATTNQFGPWLPDTMLPYGVFFDDDGNPETDAALMAWYGWNPAIGALGWMSGSHGTDSDPTPFQEITAAEVTAMGENLAFTMGEIDDLVNVGLDYLITIGNVSTFNSSTITIRVIPHKDTSGAGAPPYVGEDGHPLIPVPELTFSSSDADVLLDPNPTFVVGGLLTARVGDADLNADPAALETVDVTVTSSTGLSATLTLEEQGENRGVFVAILPEEFSNIAIGETVTMTYVDADIGDGTSETKTSTSTAGEEVIIVESNVFIDEFEVPEEATNLEREEIKLKIENDGDETVSGSVLVTGSDGSSLPGNFNNLEPGEEAEFDWNWKPKLEDKRVAETVTFTATVIIDGEVVATATGSTLVVPKDNDKPDEDEDDD